jgi:CheY-like chemotaxis protein
MAGVKTAYARHPSSSSTIKWICGSILRDFPSASHVIEAVDDAGSAAKAASERPHLVLRDIKLPVLVGYDATRRIKVLPGLAAIPIIAVNSFWITWSQ